MPNKDYTRLIGVRCPTCSSTEFSGASEAGDETEVLTCVGCGLEITHQDLMNSNRENLGEHAREIGKEAADDFAKELRKKLQDAFRGARNIRIK
jgi:Zn ribbon nucleic-acid-binding protein